MRAATPFILIVLALALAGCRSRKTVVVKSGPRGTVVAVKAGPPPPPRVVVVKRGRPPGPRYVWVKGHYVYRSDRYVWVKGRWTLPPRGYAVWVPGHYRNGRWVRGHWR